MIGREVDGSVRSNQRQADDARPTISKTLTDPAVDDETEDLTTLRAVRETGLPLCRNIVGAIRLKLTILAVELGHGI